MDAVKKDMHDDIMTIEINILCRLVDSITFIQ